MHTEPFKNVGNEVLNVLIRYSGVWNISVGANNSVGRHNFPKFNNSVGDLLTK